jgi:predicted TIM-barrel fold metal-dependent hydrolase
VIVDAQLHAWGPDSERYPWSPGFGQGFPGLRERYEAKAFEADDLVWMMDAVAVDAAILVSPMLYGDDHSYAFDAARRHPGRFGVVGPLGPASPELEHRIAGFREQPHAVGIRVVVMPGTHEPLDGRGYARLFAAAERSSVPVFLFAPGRLGEVGGVADAHPGLTLVLDHLGRWQRGAGGEILPDLLALALLPNVAVKLSTAPSLSSGAYPFTDVWQFVGPLLEAYGPERLLWATDITTHMDEYPYCEALDWLRRSDRVSEAEKALLLGGAAERLLGFSAGDGGG